MRTVSSSVVVVVPRSAAVTRIKVLPLELRLEEGDIIAAQQQSGVSSPLELW